MSGRSHTIGSKAVQLSQPYLARHAECVGRTQEIRKILAAWMDGSAALKLSPLLVGAPGLGKNRVVYEAARLLNRELYILQGHEDITPEDLICTVRFSDDPQRKMDYLAGPLATAMIRGGIAFLDEIGKIRPRALAPLASLLDERCYLDSVLLGERIEAHPAFRFIAATNTRDLEKGFLPDFIHSRLRPVVEFGYPERKEINKILRARFRVLGHNGTGLLDRFWDLWQASHSDRLPSPRDSITLFGYALNLADMECLEGKNGNSGGAEPGVCAIEDHHLECAFETFYGAPEGGLS
jgi:MoxR-like ATPase